MKTNSAFFYILKMPHEHWIYSELEQNSLKITASFLLSGDSVVVSAVKFFYLLFSKGPPLVHQRSFIRARRENASHWNSGYTGDSLVRATSKSLQFNFQANARLTLEAVCEKRTITYWAFSLHYYWQCKCCLCMLTIPVHEEESSLLLLVCVGSSTLTVKKNQLVPILPYGFLTVSNFKKYVWVILELEIISSGKEL